MKYTKETPPLARGRPVESERKRPAARNTPAGAGKTVVIQSHDIAVKKHPRWRGEDATWAKDIPDSGETPPLARGRQSKMKVYSTKLGNTPAGAGKTVVDDLSEVDRMKHPRWRGEDMLLSLELPICIETPPLARGRPVTDFKSASITGNTPAGAGKTPK